MMLDRLALLLGFFAGPLLALRLGNRFRDRSVPARRIFWGAVIGHSLGMIVTLIATMLPPIAWEHGPALRHVLVHWSMLAGSVLGVLAAQLGTLRRARTDAQRT